jgi:hypothetical protein
MLIAEKMLLQIAEEGHQRLVAFAGSWPGRGSAEAPAQRTFAELADSHFRMAPTVSIRSGSNPPATFVAMNSRSSSEVAVASGRKVTTASARPVPF